MKNTCSFSLIPKSLCRKLYICRAFVVDVFWISLRPFTYLSTAVDLLSVQFFTRRFFYMFQKLSVTILDRDLRIVKYDEDGSKLLRDVPPFKSMSALLCFPQLL